MQQEVEQSQSVVEAALTYARLGWRVHPLRPGEKQPILRAWQVVASRDEATIRQWWQRWPTANLGVVAGITSGISVVDIDTANGKAGQQTLTFLIDRFPGHFRRLLDTPWQVTGSGGRQLFYLYDNRAGTGAGTYGRDLDGRSGGPGVGAGYCVVPPSVVMQPDSTPGTYAWAKSPLDTPLSPMPCGFFSALAQAKLRKRMVIKEATERAERRGGLIDVVALADQLGSRNEAMTALAGSLVRKGLDEDAITDILMTENGRFESHSKGPLAPHEMTFLSSMRGWIERREESERVS